MRKARWSVILLVGVLCLTLPAAPATAQSDAVSVNTTTSYSGVDGNSQAITVNATFTATSTVSGLQIQFLETESAFIEYDGSFSITTGSNVEAERTNPSTFVIQELKAGETVTISYKAYPRVLNQEQIQVTTIDLTADNPRTLDRSIAVTADLSSSPLLAYQDAQGQIQQWQWIRTIGMGGIIAILVVGIFGLGAALYMWQFYVPDAVDEKETEIVDDLDSLLNEIEDPILTDRVQELQSKYEDNDTKIDI